MTKTRIVPTWQNAIFILSGTVVSLIIVIGLQWGRPVLIPIGLAILLTFLLNRVGYFKAETVISQRRTNKQ